MHSGKWANLQAQPSIAYVPLSEGLATDALAKNNLADFSPNFVADIATMINGGTIRPQDHWEGSFVAGKTGKELEQARQEALGKANFLGTVKFQNMPGKTPLQQALNTLAWLKNQKSKPGSGSGGELNSCMDQLKELPEEFFSLGKEAGDEEGAETSGIFDVDGRVNLDDLLRVARLVGTSKFLSTNRLSTQKRTLYGKETRFKAMRSLNDVGRLTGASKSKLASGIMGQLALVENRLICRERFDRIEKKRLLYLLIDCSSSMTSADGSKISGALGCLAVLLAAVKAQDAELFVCWFDTECKTRHEVREPGVVDAFWEQARREGYRGGGTAIDRCLRHAVSDIGKLMADGLVRPELLIVTDGEDEVGATLSDLGQVRLHSVIVGGNNPQLTDLAQKSGGVTLNHSV